MDAAPDTKICTTCKEEKPLDEFHKDRQKKDERRYECKKCAKLKNEQYYQQNTQRVKKLVRRWQKNNSEKENARLRKRYLDNPGNTKIQSRKWREDNPERIKSLGREYRKNNSDKISANKARHRAAKINRSPAWADKKAILEVYEEARALQAATGIPHHVDHVVPLQGEDVSGLHVDYNLRAVPAKVNLTKSNTFDAG